MEDLQKVAPAVQARAVSDDYYERAAGADHLLATALVSGNVDVEAIAKAYRTAAINARPGQFLSAIEHIEFLARVLTDDTQRQEIREKLAELALTLRGT